MAVPSLPTAGESGPPLWPRVVAAINEQLAGTDPDQPPVLVAHSNAGCSSRRSRVVMADPLAHPRPEHRAKSGYPRAVRRPIESCSLPIWTDPSKTGKVSRMGTERQVMQGYLEALVERSDFPAYFTDDVIASFEGPIRPLSGGIVPGG